MEICFEIKTRFLIVYIIGSLSLLNIYKCSIVGGVLPLNMYGKVGDDLNITCWFYPKEVSTCQDSSNLTFFIYRENTEVPRKDITIINNTSIVYTIKNAGVMSTKYICKCKYNEHDYSAIEISTIKIGTEPQPIKDFKCYSYDFEYFYCNFTAPYNPAYVKYKLEFIVSQYNDIRIFGIKQPVEISQDYIRTCNLTNYQLVHSCNMTIENNLYSRVHEWYTFTLTATNHYGTSKEKIRINHLDSVIPPKPELTLINRTSNGLTFQWQNNRWELFYKKKGFDYDLKFLPETGKIEKKDEDFIQYKLNDKTDQSSIEKISTHDGVTTFTISLNNLEYAYTWYDVRFNVKVRTARNDGTMWSERFNGTFRTGARRPDSPPKTDIGSYTIDAKSVYLYWEKLPTYKENGANIQYEITSTKKNGEEIALKPTNKTSSYATYVALSNDEFEFTVKSVNNISYSYDGSIIRIPKRTDKFKDNYLPQRLSKILHFNNYELSWEAPKQSTQLVDYTVFWCKSKDEKFTECEDSIHFEHVDATKQNVTHRKGEHSLNFAVSANYEDFSSGMVWALCTASKDGDFPEMDISLSAQKQTILITWMLSCVYLSRIEGYYLTYCPISGSGDNCTEAETTIRIPKNVDDRFQINNLKPYTSYMINIRMYSKTVEGPNMSSPKFVTTLELAPSEPRNLRLVNLTSSYAVIEWTVPEHKNGDIRYYEIVYDNHKQIRLDKGSFPENATTIMYRIESLKSFYNYKVYVTAMTIDSSPRSNDVAFKTWMGQPDSVTLVQDTTSYNNHGTAITWIRPQELAGNTSFYEVDISVKDPNTNFINLFVKSHVPGTNCTIKRFCLDNSDIIVNIVVNVAAVNAIEKDKYDREAFGDPKMFESDIDDILSRKRRNTKPEINSATTINMHEHTELFERQYNTLNKQNPNEQISYDRNDFRCAEHISHTDLIKKYNNHEFFSGPFNTVATILCTNNKHSNAFIKQNIIICLAVAGVIIFVAAFTFYGFKKIKKMKNIDIFFPPGLTDLSQDNNPQKDITGNTELSKNPSLESLYKNENHRLLASSGNDSGFLHGNDFLSDINSSTDRIHEEDHSSTRSDSIELSDMSNESNNSSPSQSPNVNLRGEKNFMEIGKFPTTIVNPLENSIINGYVQHSALQKQLPPQPMNGYTTLEDLGKPTTKLAVNSIPLPNPLTTTTTTTFKPKQELLNSPQTPVSNPIICGYVTRKQLSEFGQQSLQ